MAANNFARRCPEREVQPSSLRRADSFSGAHAVRRRSLLTNPGNGPRSLCRARNGIDSTESESDAGRGCLVGHVKLRGKTETITSFMWTSVVKTAKLLLRPNCCKPVLGQERLLDRLTVVTDANAVLSVRNLVTGGGQPVSPKPVTHLSGNCRTRGFNSRRVHQFTSLL